MSKATAAITSKFKQTFVRTPYKATFDAALEAMFALGFRWEYMDKKIPEWDNKMLFVDSNCYITHGSGLESSTIGKREVTLKELQAAVAQFKAIKRRENKETKKRRAKRKWDATATKRTTENCPVRRDVIIAAKLNSGEVITEQAGWFDWTTGETYTGQDIASYKVLTPNKHKPKPVKTVTQDQMVFDLAADMGKSVALEIGSLSSLGTGTINTESTKPFGIDWTGNVQPDTNPKRQYGVSSVPLNMWSPLASAYGALGLYNGSLKYGKANFANTPVEASIYIAAAMRHLLAWACGQEDDPADGVPNLGGVLANIAILLEARAAGMLIDDRLRMAGYLKELDMLKAKVKALNELHAGKNPKHYTLDQE